MKIYTRTGDAGTTGLIGGQRLPKYDPVFACTGALDELNASIGLCAVSAPEAIRLLLLSIQNELFVMGSHIATPPDSPYAATLPKLDESAITRLEREIDAADAQLPPLREFILPGGSEAAARLHVARTVCRCAERHLTEFAAARTLSPVFLVYINRLSDHLFTHARLANFLAGVADIPWQKPAK